VRAAIRLAVASSSPRSWVRGHLTAVGRLGDFEFIAGGDEVALPKPAPEVYLLALDRLRLDAGQAVAVEDSAHGVVAARDAGLRCIAIPSAHADLAWFGRASLVLASAAHLSLADALARLTG
jgi:HAD superfamily hydrolase (TIGR01509 family)